MRPHMMHSHRIGDEHSLRQIEDVDRRQRLHERPIADEHAVVAERGERVAEGFRAGAVIDHVDALAAGQSQHLLREIANAGYDHLVGACRPGDLHLVGTGHPADDRATQ